MTKKIRNRFSYRLGENDSTTRTENHFEVSEDWEMVNEYHFEGMGDWVHDVQIRETTVTDSTWLFYFDYSSKN